LLSFLLLLSDVDGDECSVAADFAARISHLQSRIVSTVTGIGVRDGGTRLRHRSRAIAEVEGVGGDGVTGISIRGARASSWGFWIADLRFVNAAVRGLMHYENVMLYLEVAQREEAVREGNVG